MNDPELVCYIAVNSPISYIQYGGTVVAPIVREVLIECINILDIPKQEGGHKLNIRYYIDKNRYTVENYINKLKTQININPYYNISIVGEGDKIVTQSPRPWQRLPLNSANSTLNCVVAVICTGRRILRRYCVSFLSVTSGE